MRKGGKNSVALKNVLCISRSIHSLSAQLGACDVLIQRQLPRYPKGIPLCLGYIFLVSGVDVSIEQFRPFRPRLG